MRKKVSSGHSVFIPSYQGLSSDGIYLDHSSVKLFLGLQQARVLSLGSVWHYMIPALKVCLTESAVY